MLQTICNDIGKIMLEGCANAGRMMLLFTDTWIRIAFPVGHHVQMEYVPCQRRIHTSVIRLLPVGSKGNGICHLLLVLFMTCLQCIKKT